MNGEFYGNEVNNTMKEGGKTLEDMSRVWMIILCAFKKIDVICK
jgi:hypothetical protein